MLNKLFTAFTVETVLRTGLALVLALGFTTGCECERKTDPEEQAEEEEGASEAPAANAEASKSTAERLASVAANCSVDTQTGVISRCKNNEKQGLVRDINTNKLARSEAFPALVAALSPAEGNDEEKQISVVASKTLEAAFRNSWGDKPQQVATKEVAKQLIDVLPKLPARQATQVVPSAVHAAMLTGQQQELYAVLDALPSPDLRASGYSFVLRYGSLSELTKLKTLIQGSEEVVATSAVEALRRIPAPTEEQKQQVCELLQSLAADSRPSVAGKVAAQLVSCGGAAVDGLLTQAEAQLKNGQVPGAFVRAFDLLCLSRAGKVLGTEAQCKRERAWLEAVVANTKVNMEARQAALLGLGLQFPDDATEKLAKKYASSESAELKAVGERVARNVAAKRERTNPHGTGTLPTASSGAASAPAVSGVSPSGTAVKVNAAQGTTKGLVPSANTTQ
jgi:hypothetical protein